MQMEAMYQDVILDHYRNPHGKGLRDPYDAQVHHINPTCGDEITLRVGIDSTDGTPVVRDVSFDGQGCSISQASASVMHDQVAGLPVTEAFAIMEEFQTLMRSATVATEPDLDKLGDAIAFEGVAQYPARIKCALLAWMAFKDAAAQALAAGTETPTGGQAQ